MTQTEQNLVNSVLTNFTTDFDSFASRAYRLAKALEARLDAEAVEEALHGLQACRSCGQYPAVESWHPEEKGFAIRIFCQNRWCSKLTWSFGQTIKKAAKEWNRLR